MRLRFCKLILKLQYLMSADSGQDMVEYALVAAMIGCACVATTQNFAHIILVSYNSLTTTFEQYA